MKFLCDSMSYLLPRPFDNTYWVIPSLLLAGEYPGDVDTDIAVLKQKALFRSGIRAVVNLMEEDETNHLGKPFAPYLPVLEEMAKSQDEKIFWHRYAIRDQGTPTQAWMVQILNTIDDYLNLDIPVYVHCWGGIGRTGTVVGCFLARHNLAGKDGPLNTIAWLRENIGALVPSPETDAQRKFILKWKPGV